MLSFTDSIYIDAKAAYLKPYVCKGAFQDAKVMLVGINPATPLYPADIPIDQYRSILSNYDAFMEYYCDHRIKSGKPKYSRTRLGIHSLTHWIASTLKTAVIETNVYTYPTASVKELKKVNTDIKDQSKELF